MTKGLGSLEHSGFVAPSFITDDQHVLGVNSVMPSEVLRADGQWLDYFTLDEPQEKNGIETYACTCFNSIRLITTYLKEKYNIEKNFSERALSIMAHVTPPGADPHSVLETIRKEGLARDELLPFDGVSTFDEYHAPDPLPTSITDDAKKFLTEFEFSHSWLFYPTASVEYKQAQLTTALQSSPIGVSVYAWKERNGLYYKEIGEIDNHWTTVVGFKYGEYWLVKDSYDPFLKKLEWAFDFGFAKRIYLEYRTQNPEPLRKVSFFKKICDEIWA